MSAIGHLLYFIYISMNLAGSIGGVCKGPLGWPIYVFTWNMYVYVCVVHD